jgi:hypothetical protein
MKRPPPRSPVRQRVGHVFSSSLLVPSPSLLPLGHRQPEWPVLPVTAVGLPGSCSPSPPLSWSSLSLLSRCSRCSHCLGRCPGGFRARRPSRRRLLFMSGPGSRCLCHPRSPAVWLSSPSLHSSSARIPLIFVVRVLVFLAVVVPWHFRCSGRVPVVPFFMVVVPVVLMVPWSPSSRRWVVGVSCFERRGG